MALLKHSGEILHGHITEQGQIATQSRALENTAINCENSLSVFRLAFILSSPLDNFLLLCVCMQKLDTAAGVMIPWPTEQTTLSWVVQLTCLRFKMSLKRDLDKLQKLAVWTSRGSTRPSAGSCIWVEATPSINTGWGWRDWEQPCWERLGGTGGWKAGHEPPMCTHSPEGQPYPGLHQEKLGQQVEGGDSAPLLHTGETPPGVLCPVLEPSGNTWTCWSRSGGRPQRWSEGWSTSPTRKGWESWGLFSLENRRLQGGLLADFHYLKGVYRKDGENTFSSACCNRTRSNGFKLRI